MITGMFGNVGSGKTLYLGRKVQYDLKRKKHVFSNINFNVPENRFKYIHYYKNLDDLMRKVDGLYQSLGDDFYGATVIIDELPAYADARQFKNFSQQMRYLLPHNRKYGLDMWYTAQYWGQVDNTFRNLTNIVFNMSKILTINTSRKAILKGRFPIGIFRLTEYDVEDYRLWKEGMREDYPKRGIFLTRFISGVLRTDFIKLDRFDRKFFDTLQNVELPFFTCVDCGGVLKKRCKCGRSIPRLKD